MRWQRAVLWGTVQLVGIGTVLQGGEAPLISKLILDFRPKTVGFLADGGGKDLFGGCQVFLYPSPWWGVILTRQTVFSGIAKNDGAQRHRFFIHFHT